jgi:peptidoglycan hydrolase CwlO-like protein
MKRKIILMALVITLAACSSAPQVTVPSGNHRVPVNNAAALSAYQAQIARVDSEAAKRSELEATVNSLQKQVAELKTYILLKTAETEINTPKGVPAARVAAKP